MESSRLSYVNTNNCSLPFLDPSGNIVFFDIQSAEPGTFTVPGVIELETYEPGSMVETSWIFFKGDPQAGPQPGHPFERPFNDSAKFSIDIVRDNDTSTKPTAPTNSSLFWKGGAPFGPQGNHSMYIPRLDSSCKYYSIGEMVYRWTASKDIEEDSVFRLKLTTDVPPTTHLSGKLKLSHTDAASSSSARMDHPAIAGLPVGFVAGVVLAVIISVLLTWWVIVRLRRGSQRIVLE
ncbi:hypothetical protein LTR37_011555 [Vermiconidia calcicola]|uniref:Uncharacterized protein n=1 Tax=Vermiconidia calcicola TaxID=1690605 RepID=A0ACC3N268_9PEZI|nr:hypothetical protein LTR37_011555 [Vermiconidia calcicola]